MNFDFLPWQLQVVLLLFCLGVTLHAAITRRTTGRKGLFVMYVILVITFIIITVMTILRYNTELFVLYPNVFIITAIVLFFVIYFQLSFLVFNFRGNAQKAKIAKISYGVMSICVLFLIGVYIILK